LATYEKTEGTQKLQYSWQFYTKPGFDSNYYLVNPKYDGTAAQPEFIGRVVRGMTFADGSTGDGVVAVRPSGGRWVDVTGPGGATVVLYRLQKAPAVAGTVAESELFKPVTEGAGSIMSVLDSVSVGTIVPNGHVMFNGTESSRTNAGLVITKLE
jgi:hypothetical protein